MKKIELDNTITLEDFKDHKGMPSRVNLASMSHWPEYQAWNNLMYSMTHEDDTRYQHYKKYNINVCDRWQKVENFFEDLGRRPKGFVLGRMNATKDFSPENCGWMTRSQNFRNLKAAKEIFIRQEYDADQKKEQKIEQEKPKPIFIPDEIALRHIDKLDQLLDLSIRYSEQDKVLQKNRIALDALICKVDELQKTRDRHASVDTKMFDFLDNI